MAHIDEIHDEDDEVIRHNIEVTMFYKTEEPSGSAGKAKLVNKNVTKKGMGKIVLQGLRRVDFARTILQMFSLEDCYAPREEGGFPFKLACTGPR